MEPSMLATPPHTQTAAWRNTTAEACHNKGSFQGFDTLTAIVLLRLIAFSRFGEARRADKDTRLA
jgi:hypothetical protein